MIFAIWLALALGAVAALAVYFMQRRSIPADRRGAMTAWPAALAFFLLYAGQCYALSIK